MNKSILIALPLLACIVLSPFSIAGTAQTSTNHLVKMSAFNLSSLKWQNRVLLVFAPSPDYHTYQQQMQLFGQHSNDFAERDLVLVQVLATGQSYANKEPIDEYAAAKLRARFGVDKENFQVILVGKDGSVKRTDSTPVQAAVVFEQIDAMPMRQQEMQERKRN